MTERTDSYHEGAAACRSGLPLHRCPYDANDIRRVDWMQGWHDAEATAPIRTPHEHPPLPLAPRETAPYYVVIRTFQPPFAEKKATVYVKEGNLFRAQGGLTGEWGKAWTPIYATSLNDARLKAHASVGTICPRWHLEAQSEPEKEEAGR
jgi:hypothetical protein